MFLRRNAPADEDLLGSYFSHEFCIELTANTPLVDAHGHRINPLPAETLSTFGHEYYHYLQNISTVSGFAGYHATQQLLAIFSHTIDRSGSSSGSSQLSHDKRRLVAEIVAYLDLLEGEGGPEEVRSLLAVRSFDLKSQSIPFGAGTATLSELTVVCEVEANDGSRSNVDYCLGTYAIEEGLAFEIDRIIAGVDGHVVNQDDAPAFPYFALRRLAEHIAPDGIERAAVIACGVLALLCTDPARALIDGLRDFAVRRRASASVVDALRAVEEALRETRVGAIETILSDIEGLKGMHARRGLTDNAMTRIGDLFSTLLRRRLRDPFWDIRPFSLQTVNHDELTKLLHTVEPCLVLQGMPEVKDDPLGADRPEHDIMIAFGATGVAAEEMARHSLPVLQCQVHYVSAHLSDDDFIPSDEVDEGRACCPFYRACGLQLRRDYADVCKRSPWRILERSHGDTCWYGAAVASTLGEVMDAPSVRALQ
jgi:hypothetical protein